MKKKITLLIVILIIGTLLGMFAIDDHMMKTNQPIKFWTWGKDYTPIANDASSTESNEEEIIEENSKPEVEEEKYVDENNVKLSLYTVQGDNLVKIKDDYYCDWSAENVMGLFFAIPSEEDTILNSNFNTMWKEKISAYPNAQNYRIGYNIKFTLNNGEIIDKTILNPDDAFYMFPKVMTFLYDDVNLVPGKTYYHITQDVMYDYTICSSIKLVGDVDTKNIASDIELTAFSFDTEDDFDPDTSKYRGNSFTTITIKRK